MILLRLISWQYTRKHLLRSLLTIAGIVLGVAVFVGMHTANQSVLTAFTQTVDRIAGATQLQISAGEAGFEEDILERVQNVPEVRVAVPVIEAVMNPQTKSQANILILAVDMTGDRSLRDYALESGDESFIEDPLVFLAQPDSIMITREFAAENDLKSNSELTLNSMDGPKKFIVRGIMKSSGLTTAFGGNLAIMDVYAAQKIFGRGRRFDRIDVAVQEGLDPAAVQVKLEKVLGSGFQVEPPSSRAKQFESLSSVYGMLANITSLFALFIGMFLIYNSFAIAVTQRRSEIGILRALGATRRQIQVLFLAESAVGGLVGAGLGVVLGILIARGIAGSLGQFLGEVYGVAQKAEEVSSDPRLLVGAMVLGVVTSLIAAWIPARNAARVDPVQALQKGRFQLLTAGENRMRRWTAFGLLSFVGVSLAFGHGRLIFYAGYFAAIFAGVLLVPTLGLWLARGMRPALKAIWPVEGTLAADSLIQSPRRTSGAVTALALSVSLIIALGGMTQAAYASIEEWLRVALNPDMYLAPTQNFTDRSFRFPAELASEVEKLPGVRRIQAVRIVRLPMDGEPVMFVALDVSSVTQEARLPIVSGDGPTMYSDAAAGKGVIISDNFALMHNRKRGDVLTIPTPGGPLQMPVLGVVVDFSDQKGSILLDRSVYDKYFKDTSSNVIRIYLQAGVTVGQMRERIAAQAGTRFRYFVFTNEDLRSYILKITDQWFGLTYIQIAVAVLVSILGIVNTLTVSITDRRRELGVLQAVGGLRRQIRGTIWLEAVLIGAIGLILGCGFGAVALYYALETSARDLSGMRLAYGYPFRTVLALIPIILGSAFLASLAPAEAAVRGSLVEALEYE
ncbi:MAG: FtsX-like permease family protein [Acidobacteria bacterium]|nr:FtsX-like permease family protein [Acidobacteriota bacterium]